MKSRQEVFEDAARKRAVVKPNDIDRLVKLHFGGRQAALAALLGVNHGTIYNYVEGNTTPPLGTQMIMRQWLDNPDTIPTQRQSA